jgi:hypothetical protein
MGWHQFGILKVTECAVIVGSLANQSIFLSLFQLAGKSPAGHGGIGLEYQPEHDISQRQPRSPEPVFRLRDTIAEVSKQSDKMLLLVGLSLIIRSPFLSAGHLDRLGVGGSAVRLGLSLDYELYCVDVLARQSPLLEVGAGAKRLFMVKAHEISPISRLRGDFPAQPVLFNLACVRYHQSFCFSLVHFNTPSLSRIINNISQIREFVNTPNNIFLINFLTTYIHYDILSICIKKKGRLSYSVALAVVMYGFPRTLTKNQKYALILNAIVLTGKNPVRVSKRGWSESNLIQAMDVVGYK